MPRSKLDCKKASSPTPPKSKPLFDPNFCRKGVQKPGQDNENTYTLVLKRQWQKLPTKKSQKKTRRQYIDDIKKKEIKTRLVKLGIQVEDNVPSYNNKVAKRVLGNQRRKAIIAKYPTDNRNTK